MGKKTQLTDAIIEVTRRCNLRCEHCLRGDVQPLNLDPRLFNLFMDKLSEDVDQIYTLTLTGGEPFLVPHIIRECIEIIRGHEIEVTQLFVSTNGKVIGMGVQDAVLEIGRYNIELDDGPYLGIKVSSDQFHEPLNRDEITWWSVFSHVTLEKQKELFEKNIIPEGRGMDISRRKEPWPIWPIGKLYLEGDSAFEENLYLNAKGDVSFGCDYSYESQDIIPHMHVSEFTLKKMVKLSNEQNEAYKIVHNQSRGEIRRRA